MKIFLSHASLVILMALVVGGNVSAQPVIYIVRHAEKLAAWLDDETLDSFHPLSTAGVARAQKLADQFKPGDVAAVFSSRTTRSLHTALPLAQKLNLKIEVAEACMDTSAIATFYKSLARRFKPNQAVVLISHSNIIPYLLAKAGLAATCFQKMRIKPASPNAWLLIEGYDNIWKIDNRHADGNNCAGFTRLKF